VWDDIRAKHVVEDCWVLNIKGYIVWIALLVCYGSPVTLILYPIRMMRLKPGKVVAAAGLAVVREIVSVVNSQRRGGVIRPPDVVHFAGLCLDIADMVIEWETDVDIG
jgi:hypothetical protein